MMRGNTPLVLRFLAEVAGPRGPNRRRALRWLIFVALGFALFSRPEPAYAEEIPPGQVFVDQLSAGAAAGLVAVPLSAGLGAAFGSVPNNLVVAALPPLLLFLFLPPLAVVLSESLFAEHVDRLPSRFWPAFLVTSGVQLGVLIVAVVAGADARSGQDLVVLTAVDAALLAGTSSAMLMLSRPGGALSAPELGDRPTLGGGAVVWRF